MGQVANLPVQPKIEERTLATCPTILSRSALWVHTTDIHVFIGDGKAVAVELGQGVL